MPWGKVSPARDNVMTARRFPAPWTVETLDGGGFKVVDSNKQALAYVSARGNRAGADNAKVLTIDGEEDSGKHRQVADLTRQRKLIPKSGGLRSAPLRRTQCSRCSGECESLRPQQRGENPPPPRTCPTQGKSARYDRIGRPAIMRPSIKRTRMATI
jgi:hypothetical protein